MYKNIFKRVLDFLGALFLLIFLSPMILIVTILLLVVNQGKPFFFQKRPGKNEKAFSIVKFKTMNDKKGENGELLLDKYRLTTIGKIVRKTSLDELPQLINVLTGEMRFIGPRPLLIRDLPYYTEKERVRHSMRPGITGLAQVSGRNLLDWDSRLAKDIEYVENISFKNDFTIVVKTIKKVLLSEDIVIDPESIIVDLDALRKNN